MTLLRCDKTEGNIVLMIAPLYYYLDERENYEDRLYKKLEAYGRSDFYPFHMPGHKRNPLAVDGDFPVERDIAEINVKQRPA